MTSLHTTIENHVQILHERLHRARGNARTSQPGGGRTTTDDFLVATSQHLAAVADVVLPTLKKLVPGSDPLAHDFLATSKVLERILVVTKAKQYGQAQNVGRAWKQVWEDVDSAFADLITAERAVIAALSPHLGDGDAATLGRRITDKVERCPTRPHPHLPHRGVAGKMARSVWSRADRVWDELEGRVIHPIQAPDAS